MSEWKQIVGYCTPWSLAPGDCLEVKVSTYDVEGYEAQLVRVVCGDDRPLGAGWKEEVVESPFDGTHRGRRQSNSIGSYVEIPHRAALDEIASFTAQAYVFPTTPRRGIQGLIAQWDEAGGAGFKLHRP